MSSVPTLTLDELAADPRQASELPPEALAALASKCAVAHGAIASAQAARLIAGDMATGGSDKLLTIEQAAERLSITKDALYRMSKTAPFAVRLGPGQLRFSSAGIDEWIRAKMLKPTV